MRLKRVGFSLDSHLKDKLSLTRVSWSLVPREFTPMNHLKRTFYCGIDVAQKENMVALIDSEGKEIVKPFKVSNDQSGAEELEKRLEEICQAEGVENLKIASESTSFYDYHLADYLAESERLAKLGTEIYRLNPKITHNFKKTLAELDKTDLVDARVIAERLRFGRLPCPYHSLKEIDRAIKEELAGLSQTLTSVPGIGPVFAAGIIAEIGEVTRFRSPDALAKYAGLWWPQNQSGELEGTDRKLRKSGNKYLRYYLVEAANSLRVHNEEYQAFYQKKYKEVRLHQHKRALVLSAKKLIRLVFSLLKTKQLYWREKP